MTWEQFRAWVFRRRAAYARTFMGKDGKPHVEAQRVLADLAGICKPYGTTHSASGAQGIDPIAAAIQEGKRLVFVHIMQQLYLDEKDVMTMHQPKE